MLAQKSGFLVALSTMTSRPAHHFAVADSWWDALGMHLADIWTCGAWAVFKIPSSTMLERCVHLHSPPHSIKISAQILLLLWGLVSPSTQIWAWFCFLLDVHTG